LQNLPFLPVTWVPCSHFSRICGRDAPLPGVLQEPRNTILCFLAKKLILRKFQGCPTYFITETQGGGVIWAFRGSPIPLYADFSGWKLEITTCLKIF